MDESTAYTAFCGNKRIANGSLAVLLSTVKEWVALHGEAGVLYFDDSSGQQVDFNLREEITPERAGPGRPKLGVISREVTLLPRHWEWLQDQPGGASAALRRLVDEARNTPAGKARQRRHAAGRFLTAMAGDLPGYEETTRALYAGDEARFLSFIADWPDDVRDHAARLADLRAPAAPNAVENVKD